MQTFNSCGGGLGICTPERNLLCTDAVTGATLKEMFWGIFNPGDPQ